MKNWIYGLLIMVSLGLTVYFIFGCAGGEVTGIGTTTTTTMGASTTTTGSTTTSTQLITTTTTVNVTTSTSTSTSTTTTSTTIVSDQTISGKVTFPASTEASLFKLFVATSAAKLGAFDFASTLSFGQMVDAGSTEVSYVIPQIAGLGSLVSGTKYYLVGGLVWNPKGGEMFDEYHMFGEFADGKTPPGTFATMLGTEPGTPEAISFEGTSIENKDFELKCVVPPKSTTTTMPPKS